MVSTSAKLLVMFKPTLCGQFLNSKFLLVLPLPYQYLWEHKYQSAAVAPLSFPPCSNVGANASLKGCKYSGLINLQVSVSHLLE